MITYDGQILTKVQEQHISYYLDDLENNKFSDLFSNCGYGEDFVALYLFFKEYLKVNVILTQDELKKYERELNAADCVCALSEAFPELRVSSNDNKHYSFDCCGIITDDIGKYYLQNTTLTYLGHAQTNTIVETRVKFDKDQKIKAYNTAFTLSNMVDKDKFSIYAIGTTLFIEANTNRLTNLKADELVKEVKEIINTMHELVAYANKEKGN